MVVQILILNQDRRLILGLASDPPILTFPNPEKYMAIHTKNMRTGSKMISQPNSLTMKELAVLTILVNRLLSARFIIIHTKNRKNGGKKTSGFIFFMQYPSPESCFLSFCSSENKSEIGLYSFPRPSSVFRRVFTEHMVSAVNAQTYSNCFGHPSLCIVYL